MNTSKSLLVIGFLLCIVALAIPQTDGEKISAARRACEAMGWSFDAERARVSTSARNPQLIWVIMPRVTITLYGPQLVVRSLENSGYQTQRRQHLNRRGPLQPMMQHGTHVVRRWLAYFDHRSLSGGGASSTLVKTTCR